MATHFLTLTLTLTLSTSLFLLLLSHSPTLTTATTTTPAVVLDLAGNPVQSGGAEYHILPVGPGFDGGITRAGLFGQKCPLYTTIGSIEAGKGRLVKFYPTNSTLTQIFEHSDFRIDSGFGGGCRGSREWRILQNSAAGGRYEVVAAGVPGETPVALFQAKRVGYSIPLYSVVYSEKGFDLRVLRDSNSGLRFLGFSEKMDEDEGVLNVVFVKKN